MRVFVRVRLAVASCAISAFVTLAAVCARPASADPVRWHLEAGGAHALGDPQGSEYGFGPQGAFAAELPLSRALGLQLELGGVFLPDTGQPANPALARHGDGSAETVMGGVRLRPTATAT